MTNCTLMRSKQPTLEQRHHLVNMRQQMFVSCLLSLHLTIMGVSRQIAIGRPAVRAYHAARFDHLRDKLMQGFAARIGNAFHANATDLFPRDFNGDGDQRLASLLTANDAMLFTAPIRFVHLDSSTQAVTSRSNHRTSKFMQPCPRRRITSQTQFLLQTDGTGSVFPADDMPHDSKPQRQRFVRVVKNRSGGDRRLMLTLAKHQTITSRLPVSPSFATRTNKPVRPTQAKKVVQSLLISLRKYRQNTRFTQTKYFIEKNHNTRY